MTSKIFQIKYSRKRIYGLDIMRTLAISFVMLGHSSSLIPHNVVPWIKPFILDGVSIFFVLSGFLIGGILIKTIEKEGASFASLLNFWIRRWFRTLPNYFLILILILGIKMLYFQHSIIYSVKSYFIFAQNLFTPIQTWFFPESWSLTIEEWFYLTVAFLIFASIIIFKITNRKALLYSSLCVLLFSTIFRHYRFSHLSITTNSDFELSIEHQVVTRLDSIMYGLISAYLAFYHAAFWRKNKNWLFGVGILLFLFVKEYVLYRPQQFDIFLCVFSFSLTGIATAMMLPYLSNIVSGKGKIFNFITVISISSYSMYLINLSLVKAYIINKIPWPPFASLEWGYVISSVKVFLFWSITIALSILLYKHYEHPITQLRDKFSFKNKKIEFTFNRDSNNS